mgnify:CR=1 FL=1|jgi:hypothetical protein
MKHTQGKWELSIKGVAFYIEADTLNGEEHIAEVFGHSVSEVEANARLIASAPELLEALLDTMTIANNFINNHDGHIMSETYETIDNAIEIIKKATGEL